MIKDLKALTQDRFGFDLQLEDQEQLTPQLARILSRRTHRMVSALISCQYSLMALSVTGDARRSASEPSTHQRSLLILLWKLVLDRPAGVGDEDIIQTGPVVVDEFQAAVQPVCRFQNRRNRLLR